MLITGKIYECYAGLAEPTDPLTKKWTQEAILSTPSPPLRRTSRIYEFLKSKKIAVECASKLNLSKDIFDHHAELVKAAAESSSNSSMSSDDESR